MSLREDLYKKALNKKSKDSMLKKAEVMNGERKSDAAHTGIIFGAGLAGTAAANMAGKALGWSSSVKKMTALGGLAALGTDYAAVKINKHIGNKGQTKQASEVNRYLEKIVYLNKG